MEDAGRVYRRRISCICIDFRLGSKHVCFDVHSATGRRAWHALGGRTGTCAPACQRTPRFEVHEHRRTRDTRHQKSTGSTASLQSNRMIRRGKVEGWLWLPSEAILPWATMNNVSFDRTVSGTMTGRGGALLAKESLNAEADSTNVLLTVPRDLILSLERVQEHAKTDRDFREVLERLGDFGRVGEVSHCFASSPHRRSGQLLADRLSDVSRCNPLFPSNTSFCVVPLSLTSRQHPQCFYRVSSKQAFLSQITDFPLFTVMRPVMPGLIDFTALSPGLP